MRVEAEDRAAAQVRRALLDDADVEVAVLDRAREVALLERRPHRGVLARRDSAAEHQRLGAAADAGDERAHEHVVRAGVGQRDRPDLAVAGRGQPEGLRLVEVARRCCLLSWADRGRRLLVGTQGRGHGSHTTCGRSRISLVLAGSGVAIAGVYVRRQGWSGWERAGSLCRLAAEACLCACQKRCKLAQFRHTLMLQVSGRIRTYVRYNGRDDRSGAGAWPRGAPGASLVSSVSRTRGSSRE